jgi:hypothetical protein
LVAAAVFLGPASGQAYQAPALTWSPSTAGGFDYGTVAVGQTIQQVFTLNNSGASATAVLSITMTGSPAFFETVDGCSVISLGPHHQCTVTVGYSPGAAGVSESGTLVATSKKTSMSLTLTGTLASGDISIYWANAARGAIGRADLDGSNVNESFISSGSEPVAVAVDHATSTGSTKTMGRSAGPTWTGRT